MRREELDKLINKYQIKVNLDQELHFKQLIKMRCQKPAFYYEFKRHRTVLMKEKEPAKPELYHVTYMKMIEKEKKEKQK